jgi:hypothetical protein
VLAHYLLDVDGGFACVVEWDCRDEVVAHVCADDVVEQMGVDEAKITVNGCSCTSRKSPGIVGVVGKAAVGVLEEGDGNWRDVVSLVCRYKVEGNVSDEGST